VELGLEVVVGLDSSCWFR